MDRKSLPPFEVKDESQGLVQAVFATLNVKDKDDDVTLPGAFKNGQEVVISAYGHKTWEGAPPVGKGVIREVGNQAVFDGQFFLDTAAGRDTFAVVKHLGPKQEWSYGYDVNKSDRGEHEGKSVRFLKDMDVYEVSPVLRGAGEGTRTLATKGEPKTLNEEISAATAVVRDAVESAGRVAALRAEQGKSLSQVNVKSLEELDAAVAELKGLLTVETETKTDDSDELRKIWLQSVAATLESE